MAWAPGKAAEPACRATQETRGRQAGRTPETGRASEVVPFPELVVTQIQRRPKKANVAKTGSLCSVVCGSMTVSVPVLARAWRPPDVPGVQHCLSCVLEGTEIV